MRKLNPAWTWVVRILSFALVLFQLYTTGVGPFSDIIQRSIHLAFVLSLLFILKPASRKIGAKEAEKGNGKVPAYDIVLALVSCISCVYLVSIADRILYDPLQWLGTFDKVCAVVLVFLILEASRRSVGWTFPILGILFLAYAFFGEMFPGSWGHQNFSFNLVFQTFYHNTRGIWGTMLGLSATMLAMFGIFGAILSGTGGAETFIKMGQRFTGRYTGGSAKVACLASSLFGMISGSAIGNVVATGVFTIPAMKKAGYPNEWAATVEAVSSTGGQIMPPIMGAAAFIMAQLIGVSYLAIAKAAIVPAILYYISCFVAIHLISSKLKIKGSNEKPRIGILDYLVILLPLCIFIVYICMGYTVLMGAFWATLGALVMFILKYIIETKGDVKAVAKKTGAVCYNTVMNGTTSIVDMCGILAGSQITVSLINLTGFGVKLSDIIVSLGQGNPFLCLLFSMLVCIILGMGLPTTAAYVLAAAVLAPPLVSLGFPLLVVHLFIMYYACLSAITPPVCVAVFMASGLAKAKWFKVGCLSCMIALPVFIIPFTFCYNEALMLNGSFIDIVLAILTAIIGVVFIDVASTGYFKKDVSIASRLILAACGVLLVIPSNLLSLTGFIIGATILFLDYKFYKGGQLNAKVGISK
ncbi:MAG: TRAP transporter fused permease subunit [Sphaerochaetaceae bacterium]|jgi:TRAP transporter 4TM/12TM fusion protein|nr:TRAP transporter fused permease subunit [Sphaerochaetaceae bacterium]